MKILSSRLIVLLTPLFTAASAAIVGWIVKTPFGNWLGFFHVGATEITAAMITGAVAALGAAITFLHHNAWWEKYVSGVFDVVDDSSTPAVKQVPKQRR